MRVSISGGARYATSLDGNRDRMRATASPALPDGTVLESTT